MNAVRARHVAEASVTIEVNGQRLFRTTATPLALDALAVGRLAADGFIEKASDVLGLEVAAVGDHCHRVRLRIDPGRELAARAVLRHCDEHGGGVLCLATCLAAFPVRDPRRPLRTPAMLPLLRALAAAEQAERGETGGMHGCGVVVGEEIPYPVFDVGRHSAADKAIGTALLGGLAPADCGIVTTARISGELAAKAARAGFAWIGSRSIATSLALLIAGAAGMPMVTRGASSDPMLHLPADSAPS